MMIDKGIYADLLHGKKHGKKRLGVLFDPDKFHLPNAEQTLQLAIEAKVDYFLIGGSLVVSNMLNLMLEQMRVQCDIPIVLFPGNTSQISNHADALLFLSLISGRNAELLIGQHVVSAPFLKASPLEVISTGYMLIDGGVRTSVQYMSNTQPIPSDKNDIAACTALAGEMLGLKVIYLEAGSGAVNPVPYAMVRAVSEAVSIPVIVGGGIRTPEQVAARYQAGADMVVVGTAFEKAPLVLSELASMRNG